ncbi:hypothetical protein, partial [Actinophytocola sp.]|uniref:hypothetical protein n=1 Tax=Actinophytocola sp. TaxID=1872138 RepID=UPI002ED4505F
MRGAGLAWFRSTHAFVLVAIIRRQQRWPEVAIDQGWTILTDYFYGVAMTDRAALVRSWRGRLPVVAVVVACVTG